MNKYHFDLRPDNYWVFYISKTRRLFGRGNIFTDKHLTKYLNGIENGKVLVALACMIEHYGVRGKSNLIDVKDDSFMYVKNERGYLSDAIGTALQRLVDELP